MKTGIKEISLETGFSPATVSNALRRKKGVKEETVKIIHESAKRLGYYTEKKKLSLRFVTFRKNGKIIDDSLIFPAMIEGVEKQAKRLGYETVFSRLDYEEESFNKRLKEVLTDTSSLVILLGTEMQEEDYQLFKNYQGYMIVLDGWSETSSYDGVLINNTDAMYKVVDYLLQKGHRQIGYLRGDYRIKGFIYREYGFYRKLRECGIEVKKEHIVTVGTRIESAYEKMKEYLKDYRDMPTAFVAENDVIALGAMRALQEYGYRIPQDISIVGFDDIRFGAISSPALTTVKVFKQEMGETAVRRALNHITYGEDFVKMKIQVATKFIERDSVCSIE